MNTNKPTYIFDIETNGLLDSLDRIHCLVMKDVDTGELFSFRNDGDKENLKALTGGLGKLMDAKRIIGHNIIKFDIPALKMLFPWFEPEATGVEIEDTLVETRLIWPDLMERDAVRVKAGKMPGRLIGAQGLEAWGYRLGLMKGEYTADFKAAAGSDYQAGDEWAEWSQAMQDYCDQDVEVSYALWKEIQKVVYSPQALMIEHRFADIIGKMERNGFSFNREAAGQLYADLVAKRQEIGWELKQAFPPKEVTETFIPKVNNKTRGYTKWVPFTKRWMVEFNPSSRQMIADRLIEKGWAPTEFTPSGQPKIDETILSKLPYPEAQVLARHFLIEKRIGQIAEGDQAWLRLERQGRMHGSVNTNGAVTGRCTHSTPNIAQVPKVKAGKVNGKKAILEGEAGGWGYECRALFSARKGWALVGIDLAGVELRCLAHYMARYDDGAYGRAVIEGREPDGTDVHSLNAKALGLDPRGSYVVLGKTVGGRDLAKTFI